MPMRRIAVFFKSSVAAFGEAMSLSVPLTVDSIGPTTDPELLGQGLDLIRVAHDRARNGAKTVLRAFVPWGNVGSVKYGE